MLGIGIVGLPNVGKSTLFNAITKAMNAESQNYPFCTIEPNVGIVTVPDKRLEVLAKVVLPKKISPATVEFIDIAGLVKGASKGEGLGNQFLSNIRQTAALCQVVRCFEDENIIHVEGNVNPIRDIEIINTELILADLDTVERNLLKNQKLGRTGNKEAKALVELFEKLQKHLEDSKLIKQLKLSQDEQDLIKPYQFLTLKPMIFAANVAETELSTENEFVKIVKEYAMTISSEVITISAQVESELIDLTPSEQIEFLADLGVEEPGLDKLIRAGYKLLDLITYFTAGVQEVRAWTIKKNTKAPAAASEIHSDIERGFIRAEVAKLADFDKYNGWTGVKEKGAMKLEGKEYIVEDGDVIYFRFNV
ncbi:MAG: redox-regulated ATPase YchF [Fusobacteria bacterium]|nr:redox-regulated ATPase YchF [Fusobacteriota bacterium]